jgi:hypothetical protein
MKNILVPLLLSALFWLPGKSFAQTNAQNLKRYTLYAYMKVAPGMEEEYLKMEKVYKKIHAAAKKAGKLETWSLARVMMPAGAHTEYNYVARNVLLGDEQLSNYMEGGYDASWMSGLTKEEMDLVNRTDNIRTMVKAELWSQVDGVFAPDMSDAKLVVYNYFSSPEGKTRADHIRMEQDIWKPVHAARVHDGKMKGWALLEMNLPSGTSMPYNMITVDLYTGMKQYLAPWFDEYFQIIHPGKNLDNLMAQTQAATTLIRGEVYMIIDRLE